MLYVVPKLGIIFINIIIIYKLRSLLRQHLLRSNSANLNVFTITKCKERKLKGRKDELRMTKLLVVIMIAFTLLTTPVNALEIIYRLSLSTFKHIDHSITALANMLLTLNYSLNFYLYCFANR